jgi:hypothetical protein
MPPAQVMVIRLNRLFDPETILYLSPVWFDGNLTSSDLHDIAANVRRGAIPGDLGFMSTLSPGPVTLGQLARVFAVAENDFHEEFLDSIPGGLRQSLLAFIHHNLSQSTRLSMTWAWAPGYDYEVSLWECPGTRVSPGGITIMLRTRYPLDPHPSKT